MNESLVVVENTKVAQISPMSLLNIAVEKGASIEQLTQLMDLQDRFEKNEARKAFTKALSDFKAKGVVIGKDKHVSFNTSKGKTEYNHATLGNVCDVIGKALSEFGLSYRWSTEQANGKIKVTCVLMHVMGHSESVSLESGADESGGKNSIQAIGSTVSYLQRYTLTAITGTATQEQDDDGKGSGFTMADVVDESQLCDYIAAIESATTQKDMLPVYLKALEHASTLGDKDAAIRISAAKDASLAKLSGKK